MSKVIQYENFSSSESNCSDLHDQKSELQLNWDRVDADPPMAELSWNVNATLSTTQEEPKDLRSIFCSKEI